MNQAARLQHLTAKGVSIVDPRQTYVEDDVDLNRIHSTVTLYPGVRLSGPRTLLCRDVVLGREGPVTAINSALGSGTWIASGFLEDAVVLQDARIGANCHLRPGSLAEEQVKTGHCVGLKQSVLLSFVTLGSLINLCDLIVSGGTSRKDHTEVGSGFIHFNFTPWGKHGGKATPSLIGNISAGVFLRSPRIFLGGAGGLVGPRAVGFGSIVAAGQVIRKDVPPGRLVLRPPIALDQSIDAPSAKRVADVLRRNITYLAQLNALRVWYEKVRAFRAAYSFDAEFEIALIRASQENIDFCIAERTMQLSEFLQDNGLLLKQAVKDLVFPDPPLPLDRCPSASHIDWIRSLSNEEIRQGDIWLTSVASVLENLLSDRDHDSNSQ